MIFTQSSIAARCRKCSAACISAVSTVLILSSEAGWKASTKMAFTSCEHLDSSSLSKMAVNWPSFDTVCACVCTLVFKKEAALSLSSAYLLYMSDLEAVPWSAMESFDDMDDRWEYWKSLFLKVLDSHLQLRKVCMRSQTLPWISNDVRKLMRARNNCCAMAKASKKTDDWMKYR